MTTTTNLELPLVETAQAQKEVTVNAALTRIDAILNTGAKDKDLNTPPGSPAAGDVYIISTSPTGAWSGKAKHVAYYDQSWKFVVPKEGLTLWVNDENSHYTYDGTNWSTVAGGGSAGKQALWLSAKLWAPCSVNGCATLATVATTTHRPDITTLNFDPSTAEFAEYSIRMPKSWNEGTVTFAFVWSHAATTVNFGVAWTIQSLAVSNNDTIDAAYSGNVTVTDTGGTTNFLYETSETTAMTIPGTPQEGDTVFFRLIRDVSNGGDTMAIDARLHGVVLFYTTNASTDD